jgi:hypothetical protein
MAGVRVDLLDQVGHVLSSAKTSSTGRFGFDRLAAGSYQLRFRAAGGLVFTSQHVGTNSAVDSDAGADGETQPVMLGEDNPADTTVDAGLTSPANGSAPQSPTGAVPVDTELSRTGGVALSVPIIGLALIASGVSCLFVGRRNLA